MVKNVQYKIGHLVVLKVFSENYIQVGRILKVVIRKGEVFLLVRRYECVRSSYRYFDGLPVDIAVINFTSVCDYKPLICRSDEECPKFLLHHHLPFVPFETDSSQMKTV